MNNESTLHKIYLIFSILASISVVTSTFIKGYPIWLLYIGIGLVIIFSFFLFSSIVKNYVFSVLENKRKSELIRKYFPEFEDFVERFSKYMDTSRADNIPNLFRELKNSYVEFKNISPLSIYNLTALFYDFKNLIKNSKKTRENFVLLVRLFYRILIIYNNEHVCLPVEQTRDMKKEVYISYLDRYKKYKHEYTVFMEELKRFGEKVKKEFKEDSINTNFEFPKDL